MAGLDVEDPGPRLDGRRGHVGPLGPTVHRDLDVAVVGPGPDRAQTLGRQRQRRDGTPRPGRDRAGVLPGTRGRRPGLPGQIGADPGPGHRTVDRLPDHVRDIEEDIRSHRRPGNRHRSHVPVVVGAPRRGVRPDQGGLGSLPVVERHVAPHAAEDQVRIPGIGRGNAVFLNVDRVPVMERDLAVHRPAVDAGRPGVLLPAADPVGEIVVGGHVIHRGGRLIVPIAPGNAPVGRHHPALIRDGQHDTGMVRIDPNLLIVVAARSPPHRRPRQAPVFGPPHHRRCAVHDVRICRVDRNRRQVAPADPLERPAIGGARAFGGRGPVLAGVGRFIEPDRSRPAVRVGRGHHRVQQVRITRGNRDVGLEHRGQAIHRGFPGGPTVDRLVDPIPAPAEPAPFPERLLLLPQGREHDVGIAGRKANVVGAGVLILVQHSLERLTAVGRPEHPPLAARPVGVTQGRHEQPVRVGRIDLDHGDHLGFPKAQVGPGLAGIGGFVHPVAGGQIRPDDAGPRPDIDHVGVGRRHRNRADRTGRLPIEQRDPVRPVVGRPPDPAVIEPDVKHVRLTRDARQSASSAGPGRTDLTPVHPGRHVGCLGRR